MAERDVIAVILAAGLGSRLGGDGPKCLVRVGAQSILESQMRALASCGVTRATIVTGHRCEEVEAAAKALSAQTGVEAGFARNREFANTGTAISAICGWPEADGRDVLLLEGDTLIDPGALGELLIERRQARTLTDRAERLQQGSKILHDSEGVVLDWLHRRHQPDDFDPRSATKTVNASYLPAETAQDAFLRALQEVVCDLQAPLEFAFRVLVRRGGSIQAVEMEDRPWCEVDDADDLRRARALPTFHYPRPSQGAPR